MSIHAVQIKGRFYILKDITKNGNSVLLKRSLLPMDVKTPKSGQNSTRWNWI